MVSKEQALTRLWLKITESQRNFLPLSLSSLQAISFSKSRLLTFGVQINSHRWTKRSNQSLPWYSLYSFLLWLIISPLKKIKDIADTSFFSLFLCLRSLNFPFPPDERSLLFPQKPLTNGKPIILCYICYIGNNLRQERIAPLLVWVILLQQYNTPQGFQVKVIPCSVEMFSL